MIKKFGHWVIDYLYAIRGHGRSILYLKPPHHYLGHIIIGKDPVILIPGLLEKWHFLKAFADPISLAGHPIYAIRSLGFNIKDIHHSTYPIRQLINEKNLKNVIIIAHSKGGLIGKHLLAFHNENGCIKKLIAIATPWCGSTIAKQLPGKLFRELSPESKNVVELHENKEINYYIVNIFGNFDNHIWPQESVRLDGAKNIKINVHGHHRILFDKTVREIVINETTL